MTHNERLQAFVHSIWEWYPLHKRELPWRDMDIANDTERAYRVLVSEVMLQQTQVNRVKIVFRNFLERFPSIQSLASASNAEVIMAWRGMGYNARALRLRDAARAVAQEYNGKFPREMDELLLIKGLGPYTTAAIRNFAFNIPTPCIDTNVRRILHRTFVGPENEDGGWKVGDKQLLTLAEEILEVAVENDEILNPTFETNSNAKSKNIKNVSDFEFSALNFRRTAADWHAALMDYGSLVQTKNNPKWDQCILTHRKLMKTTPKHWQTRKRATGKRSNDKREPGRFVGSRYIPNRIFRGKIVEALRNEERGLVLQELGAIVCIDWEKQHEEWLKGLITKLVQDRLVSERKGRFVLAH